MTMADASTFEVRASIPDQSAARVRDALDTSQSVTADVALNEGSRREGSGLKLTLNRIAHNVRPGQSGLDAWFRFESESPNGASPQIAANPQSVPTLGRVLNLTAILPSEPGLVALPGQAVYNSNRVYTVQNNRLQAATVQRVGEIRLASGDYQVLVRGVKLLGNADVMTTALPKAITGLLVNPIRPPVAQDEAVVDSLSPQSSFTLQSPAPESTV